MQVNTVELGYNVTIGLNILCRYKRVLFQPRVMVNSGRLIGTTEYLTQ